MKPDGAFLLPLPEVARPASARPGGRPVAM